MKRFLLRAIPVLLAASTFLLAPIYGQEGSSEPEPAPPNEANAECMTCHSTDSQMGPAVDEAALAKTPHAAFACTDCHMSITETPHTEEMLKEKAACATCHSDQTEAFGKSMHSNRDFVAGDHPTCVMCHGGGKPHAITAGSKWTREQKVEVCTQCHAQQDRMRRYHVDAGAVESYHDSFHGKALLRFGNLKTAICTDCHGHHDVLSPMNPAAPTHRNNAAATCGQAGCHSGAKVNFAMSGANHLRLKVKEEPVLQGVLLFFQLLIFGTISFMMASVFLDLRQAVFLSKEPPKCGKPAAILIFLAFVSLVAAIVMATLKIGGVRYAGFATLGLLALAYVTYFLRPKELKARGNGIYYPRMNLTLRIQHVMLTLSIVALMATGLPLRFASSDLAQKEIGLLGGLDAARLTHRVAAVILIITWCWHLGYLIVRWKRAGWTFKSWTMWPTKKDGIDLLDAMKAYLGLADREPKFGRYSFRSKMDYLAEYWGLPVMVVSGFILWFPLYFSTRLPEAAWPIAFIAHGYEATLALLAIVCWHLYNVHFSPHVFPMNRAWLTGKLSHHDMQREHPLELEEIQRQAGQEAAPSSSQE